MPPEMSAEKKISMRHTKLKAEEVALISGEVIKPSWESRNEGIHERVSFEDTLWGFDLAGGAYYNTPLRVTFIKPDSRAEKAGIRPGDRLLKINGVDTSTLTIQDAHDMIVQSGIHLKLSVTSPDDFEDSFYYYEDPVVTDYDSEEERRIEEERARKRRVHAKVSSYWSLQWPWVSRRKPIYRESNCFMVPSKYEEARRDKYPVRPSQRYFDDIILYDADEAKKDAKLRTSTKKQSNEKTFDLNCDETESLETGDEYTDSVMTDDEMNEDGNSPAVAENNNKKEIASEDGNDSSTEDVIEEPTAINENLDQNNERTENEENIVKQEENLNSNNDSKNNDDNVVNEVLGKSNDSIPRNDEDNILDSILSDDGQNLENSEFMNER